MPDPNGLIMVGDTLYVIDNHEIYINDHPLFIEPLDKRSRHEQQLLFEQSPYQYLNELNRLTGVLQHDLKYFPNGPARNHHQIDSNLLHRVVNWGHPERNNEVVSQCAQFLVLSYQYHKHFGVNIISFDSNR